MNREEVIAFLENLLHEKRDASVQRIEELRESLTSEAKSTAGDKHETGRAMVQLEMEQAETSRSRNQEALDLFRQSLAQAPYSRAQAGSLVETSRGWFFLGPTMGRVKIGQEDVFVVSVASPVGKALKGGEAGHAVPFQQGSMTILQVT